MYQDPGIFDLFDSSFFFGMAIFALGIGLALCHFTLMFQAFGHDEGGWGFLLFFFSSCFPLSLFYGWSRARQWRLERLMLAYTACQFGMVAVGSLFLLLLKVARS